MERFSEARHQCITRPGSSWPAACALRRPSRQLLHPADAYFQCDEAQAFNEDPSTWQRSQCRPIGGDVSRPALRSYSSLARSIVQQPRWGQAEAATGATHSSQARSDKIWAKHTTSGSSRRSARLPGACSGRTLRLTSRSHIKTARIRRDEAGSRRPRVCLWRLHRPSGFVRVGLVEADGRAVLARVDNGERRRFPVEGCRPRHLTRLPLTNERVTGEPPGIDDIITETQTQLLAQL